MIYSRPHQRYQGCGTVPLPWTLPSLVRCEDFCSTNVTVNLEMGLEWLSTKEHSQAISSKGSVRDGRTPWDLGSGNRVNGRQNAALLLTRGSDVLAQIRYISAEGGREES